MILHPSQLQKGSWGRQQDQRPLQEIQRCGKPQEPLAELGLRAHRKPETKPFQWVFRLWLLHVPPPPEGPRGLRTPQGGHSNGGESQARRATHPSRDSRHVLRDQDHGGSGPRREDPHHVRRAVRQIRPDLWQGGGDPDESQETREGGVWRGDAVAGPGWRSDHYSAGVMLTPGSESYWKSSYSSQLILWDNLSLYRGGLRRGLKIRFDPVLFTGPLQNNIKGIWRLQSFTDESVWIIQGMDCCYFCRYLKTLSVSVVGIEL